MQNITKYLINNTNIGLFYFIISILIVSHTLVRVVFSANFVGSLQTIPALLRAEHFINDNIVYIIVDFIPKIKRFCLASNLVIA